MNRTQFHRWPLLFGSVVLPALALCERVELEPVQVADGRFESVELDGSNWLRVLDWGEAPAVYLYFRVPDSFPRDAAPVYLRVDWRESGFGTFHVQYDSVAAVAAREQSYRHAEERYGYRSFDRGVDRTAYFLLAEPRFAGGQNAGADLRLAGRFDGGRLTVRSVSLSTEAPPGFEEAAAKPWLGAYDGPSRDDIDATTLEGKILCGYQGWFNLPGDGSDLGFRHWSRDRDRLTTATLTFDMWPDVSEYPPEQLLEIPGFHYPDGSPARLYSPFHKETVHLHFRWMREYGIDGVFLSRFVTETLAPEHFRHVNQVLANVREAAHREGRVWAMMIDVSAGNQELPVSAITDDWRFLVDEARILEDSRYLRHDGKPVVLLWGFGFPDRNWTIEQARETIDFFQSDPDYGGVHLIGGTPSWWRTLERDSRSDPGWADIYRSYDAISTWTAGRFRDIDGLLEYRDDVWKADLEELKELGMGYMPAAFPGFSWDNLMRLEPGTSLFPRDGGRFYWRQLYEQQALGVRTIFVGMFDEVDEGTAIYKVTNDPPVEAHFVTYDGLPSDYYLKLTGAASKMMRGEIPLSAEIPAELPFPMEAESK